MKATTAPRHPQRMTALRRCNLAAFPNDATIPVFRCEPSLTDDHRNAENCLWQARVGFQLSPPVIARCREIPEE